MLDSKLGVRGSGKRKPRQHSRAHHLDTGELEAKIDSSSGQIPFLQRPATTFYMFNGPAMPEPPRFRQEAHHG